MISAISSGSPTTTAATITWTTDEAATSKVVYGATSAYGAAISSAGLVTSHSIGIIGLTASSTYHYAVVSSDIVGNTSTSSDQTFTTASAGADTTPPTTPTNLTAVASSSSELDLNWTASTDNVGVIGYKILRGSVYVGTTTSGTTYADTGLTASTTYTYMVKAYDAAGNISSASNTATSTTGTWSDGFANAPAGTAQYPNLLQSYAVRPPWRVAGVDYYVGVPSGTTLTDWWALTGPGISMSTNQVRVDNTSGTIFNDVDFSLHGGAHLLLVNSPNTIVTDSNFGGTSYPALFTGPIQQDPNSENLTLEYDTIDGGSTGGSENQSTLIYSQGGGNVILKYDWFKNYAQQVLDAASTTNLTYEYNFIDNTTIETSGHQNVLQWSNGTGNPLVAFNTLHQTNVAGGEGFQFYFNGSGTMSSPVLTNNTMMAASSTTVMSYIMHGSAGGSGTTLTGTAVANSNYFDITGAFGAFYPGSFVGWMGAQNYNMSTGAAIVVAPLISTISSGTPGSSTSTIAWITVSGSLTARL